MRRFASRYRLLSSAALLAALALSAAGCTTTNDPETTGSIGASAQAHTPMTDADWRRAAEEWGPRYRANTKDAQAAIYYAQALRATDQRAQAVAVLEQCAMENPENKALLGAFGRALADVGRYQQALEVLNRAHSPDEPDWHILNVQGAVLDQLGRHDEARRYYETALKIRPNDPSVLSNYGLSYTLTDNLPQAEKLLRQAVAQPGAAPKVRQNLALVVGLEGRFAEAEKIARADLPPTEAEANVAYLRDLLAKRKTWNNKAWNKPLKRVSGATAKPSGT
ncbi:MAG: Flp pilus assembly protein TadD, contains TPR repeat [Pseudolabrys sp.]|jgi:Flp pilus assembly protein TadD|nr:Flp pilus assembly protein TadD, contains TPR repeat [Pseudolabrys sp.]